MSKRVAVLVERFEEVHRQVIDYCSSLTEHEWQVLVPEEQRTVGVLFQHIAVAYSGETALIRAMVNGESIPAIFADQTLLDQVNADDALAFSDGTREETLQRLDRHARRTARYLRGLTDADLEQTAEIGIFGGERWTVEGVIEQVLIGHPQMHMAGIREALAAASGVTATPDGQ